MGRELTIRLSDEAYAALLRVAAMAKLQPEEWATDLVVSEIRSIDEDPLLKLAGCIPTDITDVGERHDEHIGQGIVEKLGRGVGG